MSERIAIIGSRNFPNPEYVEQYVSWLPPDTIVVSGGARGRNPSRSVDWVAEQAARARGLEVDIIDADWDGPLGKLAGKDRNFPLVLGSEGVAAFWDGWSNGSAHGIALAAAAGNLRRIALPGDLDLAAFRALALERRR